VPFERSYWVTPGRLLAGCYPGAADEKQAREKIRGLLDCGIRRVINLMETTETNSKGKAFVPYEDLMRTLADTVKTEVFFARMPIKDTWVPSRSDMCRILDRMDQSINDNQPVYLHCWGGRGRTGTVVGCHLVRHGYASSRNVLKRLKDLRRCTEDRDMPSPETSQQIDMVVSWVEGE